MEEEIKNALEFLNAGKTILYHTDTVWGIGCDATNEKAVKKIFQIKKRSGSKSMVVLVSDEKMLNKYVKKVPAIAWDLMEMSEKPLTIVYENVTGLATNVAAHDGSVAIRITKDEFCKRLINKFDLPIVSTSANISGEEVPENFRKIRSKILESVDYVVKWRQNESPVSKVSSIIKIKSNGEFEIIRK